MFNDPQAKESIWDYGELHKREDGIYELKFNHLDRVLTLTFEDVLALRQYRKIKLLAFFAKAVIVILSLILGGLSFGLLNSILGESALTQPSIINFASLIGLILAFFLYRIIVSNGSNLIDRLPFDTGKSIQEITGIDISIEITVEKPLVIKRAVILTWVANCCRLAFCGFIAFLILYDLINRKRIEVSLIGLVFALIILFPVKWPKFPEQASDAQSIS